jgi:general secretion pathway protein E
MSLAEPVPAPPSGEEGLSLLGMPPPVRSVYLDALRQPAGLVLVVGPAGAGKRETIEAGLGAAPRPAAEAALVMTVEDQATAGLAVASALNGRLVLAAMEAQDAIAALARIAAMEIELFLLAAAVRVIVAQRRVRRLCIACRQPVQAVGSEGALLGFDPGAVIWRGDGCGRCAGTGYDGNTGLFEVIEIDAVLRRLIAAGDAALIAGHAFRHAANLASAARALVRDGVISSREAVRLSR